MTRQQLTKLNLPDNPGVYVFRDEIGRPLYIGRATSLYNRIKSYFARDVIETRGPRIVDMVTKAKTLTYEMTDSVLEAIILESALIKQYQPDYNVMERDDKSSLYVVITDEIWPRVFLERARDFEQHLKAGDLSYKVRKYFGPFPHSGLIKEALKILRKLFPFKDKKAHDPRHEAFYRAIGKSPEANDENDRQKYLQTIAWLILFFDGKKQELKRNLVQQMDEYVKKQEFEEADRVKKLLFALDHVRDMALLKKESVYDGRNRRMRIEAYDVAHLSGKNVVGAMVVSSGGQLMHGEYRKFKISREENNDIAGLVEILSRRLNHTEWQYPDLVVVDGGVAQKQAAEAVLKSRRIEVPVIAVTKDDKHKASKLLGDTRYSRKFKDEIIAVNFEAHRFTIAYHRNKRAKNIHL